MAINFLTSVDFNDNEILGAAIQNLATDPASGVLGQLYFNTSDGVLKVCTAASTTNATWVAVGGGVETIGKATGTNPITLSGTTDVLIGIDQATTSTNGYLSSTDWNTFNNKTGNLGTVTSVELTIDEDEAISIGGTNPVTSSGTIELEWQGDSSQVVLGSGELADYKSGTVTSVGLSIDNSTALGVAASSTPVTSSGTLGLEWQGTSSEYVTADGGKVSIPSTDNYDYWTLTDGTNKTNISSKDEAKFTGTSNEITVGESSGTVTIGLPSNVTISNDLNVDSDLQVDGISTFNDEVSIDADLSVTGDLDMNTAKIFDLQDPTNAQDAATKAYVDTNIVGNLVFQGGYNAATNTPDLDSSPSSSIKQGWAYVVTAAGSFFTETVEVGDFLIAQQDAPTTLANWVTVQNNVDLATLTTVGIGNVNPGEGIDVSYANGTATVAGEDSSATNKGIVIVEGGTGITVNYNSGTAEVVSDNNGTVTSVGLSIDNSDALAVTNSPITSSGSLQLEWQGGSGEYINGEGDLVNFPSIPQGDITEVTTTAPITGGGTSGSVDIAIDTATANKIGAASVTAGTGISVSVSNGTFTITNSDPGSTASNGRRYSLGASSGAVTANGLVGGETSWTINTNTDLGKSDARDVQCEVISSAGETVYAQITRSSANLTISFNGSVTNGSYEAVLISI